jgi:hypothetical protein
MLWYEALVPAAAIALAVRYEALFFLPYWSWLQLIPEAGTGTGDSLADRKAKRQSLIRRVLIPLLIGAVISYAWPSIYSPFDVAVVGALGAGLLLWPLIFAFVYEVRDPPWMAWALYGLMPIIYAAAAVLGSWIAAGIAERGGLRRFVGDEILSVLVTLIVVVFGNALFARISRTLALNQERTFREEG